MKNFLLLSLISGLCAVPLAWGSAFAINELGVRAQGMAGAFVSIADDGSAIFYNPAGLAFQKKPSMEMDSLVVVGLFRYFPTESPPGTITPDKGWSGSVKPHFIPVASLYAVKPLTDRLVVGFGGFVPFGLAANFTNFNDGDPQNTKFPGRFAGSRAAVQSYWFQPTVSYKITPNLSLGGGVAFVHTHLFLERSILNPNADGGDFGKVFASAVFPTIDPALAAASIARLLPEGRLRAAATANSPGFNLGLMYRSKSQKSSIGMAWRSAVVNHLTGKAAFAFTDTGAITPFLPASASFSKLFPNQDIRGVFTTPGTYTVGASTHALNTLLSFDFELQDFRRFKDLPINFTKTVGTATPPEQRLAFDFHNSYIYHLGLQKQVKPNLELRLGYVYDVSPVPDKSVGPLFPDANRHSLTMGFTNHRPSGIDLSFFYQAMFFADRVTDVAANAGQFTNGDYSNFAHLGGLAMSFNPSELFGKKK